MSKYYWEDIKRYLNATGVMLPIFWLPELYAATHAARP